MSIVKISKKAISKIMLILSKVRTLSVKVLKTFMKAKPILKSYLYTTK